MSDFVKLTGFVDAQGFAYQGTLGHHELADIFVRRNAVAVVVGKGHTVNGQPVTTLVGDARKIADVLETPRDVIDKLENG
ncbi:MAG: hypothetical protein ACOC7S_00915 [Planctomycetota bacterium]